MKSSLYFFTVLQNAAHEYVTTVLRRWSACSKFLISQHSHQVLWHKIKDLTALESFVSRKVVLRMGFILLLV